MDSLTYQDAVEHVLDRFDLDRTARELRMARRAVQHAYRRLPTVCEWSYYRRRHMFTTSAAYRTGTVSYDHTGGAEERLLTLSGGTWPSDAAEGVVVIGNSHYPLDRRLSNTTATLGSANPGQDVAATAFTWYRDSYPMPAGFRTGRLIEPRGGLAYGLCYLSPEDLLAAARSYGRFTTNRPEWHTVRGNPKQYGGMVIQLAPAPSAAITYECIYIARPGELRTEREGRGTVSINAGASTVTGVGTVFQDLHVGAILRLSDSAEAPTNTVGGTTPEPGGSENAYVAQYRVREVSSATSLGIDGTHSGANLANVKYVLSDVLDMSEEMADAFLGLCDAQFAAMTNRKDEATCRLRSNELLLLAMDADRRWSERRSATGANWDPDFMLGEVTVR